MKKIITYIVFILYILICNVCMYLVGRKECYNSEPCVGLWLQNWDVFYSWFHCAGTRYHSYLFRREKYKFCKGKFDILVHMPWVGLI